MKCPECRKGEIKEQVSLKGFFKKKKEVTYFCPICGWENKKEFRLSNEDIELEKFERMNKPKESIQRYYSERKEEKNERRKRNW